MNERDIHTRDSKRDIAEELLESVRRVKAGDVGKVHRVPAPQTQFATARPCDEHEGGEAT